MEHDSCYSYMASILFACGYLHCCLVKRVPPSGIPNTLPCIGVMEMGGREKHSIYIGKSDHCMG